MMIKKRFTVENTMIRECIVDNTTGEQLDTFDYTTRLCEVLNQLNDENEQLRFDFKEFKSLLHSLEEENEQLKQQVEKKQRLINAYEQYINDLKEDGVLE